MTPRKNAIKSRDTAPLKSVTKPTFSDLYCYFQKKLQHVNQGPNWVSLANLFVICNYCLKL